MQKTNAIASRAYDSTVLVWRRSMYRPHNPDYSLAIPNGNNHARAILQHNTEQRETTQEQRFLQITYFSGSEQTESRKKDAPVFS